MTSERRAENRAFTSVLHHSPKAWTLAPPGSRSLWASSTFCLCLQFVLPPPYMLPLANPSCSSVTVPGTNLSPDLQIKCLISRSPIEPFTSIQYIKDQSRYLLLSQIPSLYSPASSCPQARYFNSFLSVSLQAIQDKLCHVHQINTSGICCLVFPPSLDSTPIMANAPLIVLPSSSKQKFTTSSLHKAICTHPTHS